MKYIVTGAAGFIGDHLATALLERGDAVVVIDDMSKGTQENIDGLSKKGTVTFYKRGVEENLDDIFEKEKVDGVFHFAALPRVQFSMAEPMRTHKANVDGTVNLLDTARRFGVKRFVYSSSSSVYGDQPVIPFTEDMKPAPMSPYALHKYVGEQYCALYSQLFGMETISLRYFNVYGPKQHAGDPYMTVICKFSDLLLRGESPTIFGDGTHKRDYTYVTDVVAANLCAMAATDKAIFGEVFNVGAGNPMALNDVVKKIYELTKSTLELKHGPEVIEPKATFADVSKSRKMLGWEPKVKFEEGIVKTMNYYFEYYKEYLKK